MKKDNDRFSISRTGCKSALLIALLGFALASCKKEAELPSPPQAPPKPQATPAKAQAAIQKAVFSYSKSPTVQYQDGRGRTIVHRVIRT